MNLKWNGASFIGSGAYGWSKSVNEASSMPHSSDGK